MNLLRVLLCSVLGLHPSDVPPKSKIPVKIEKCGNGRRNGAFLHISFKIVSNCGLFGVRQRPPCGVEFVCIPCEANNSKSRGGDTVRVRPPPPAPNRQISQDVCRFFTFLLLTHDTLSLYKVFPEKLNLNLICLNRKLNSAY